MDDLGGETKTCRRCGEHKPTSDFGEVKQRGVVRRRSYCKPCHAANVREYRQRNLETVRARELVYSRENAEKKRQVARDWYAANRERALASRKEYYADNKERVLSHVMQSRARKSGAPSIEAFTRDEIVVRDLGRCHLCGEPVNPSLPRVDPGALNLDHVVPLSEGGTHTRDNVRVAHRTCNLARRKKRAKLSP